MKFLTTAEIFLWATVVSPLHSQAHAHVSTETLGSVTFTTSCSPAVQPRFNRAVALMHSFQFGSAIQGFNSVLKDDPKCAIADWGIALSSWQNPFAGSKSAAQLEDGLRAVDQGRAIDSGTPRERAYLEAVAHLYVDTKDINQPARFLAYEQSMAALRRAYPEDTEATIFYALALAADADPSDKTYAKQLEAGALLEDLFAKYPDHLGDWQASIDTNAASAAAALVAHQPADLLHASDYMVYAYLQTAQDRSAKRLVESSAQVFATFDPAHANGAAPASAAYYAKAAIPARYLLERQLWAQAAKLEPLSSPFPYANAITYFARGLGAAHGNDKPDVQEAIRTLEQIGNQLAQVREKYWANQIEIDRQELVALLALVEGREADALAGMRHAVELEDKTEKAAVSPGPLKPAREMFGEMLLQLNRPEEALLEFQATLTKEPNRFWALYGAGKASKRAGDRINAAVYFTKLLAITSRADQPGRPELVEARAAIRQDEVCTLAPRYVPDLGCDYPANLPTHQGAVVSLHHSSSETRLPHPLRNYFLHFDQVVG